MDIQVKLSEARECIKQALTSARNPVLMWSSGKDSQLLLHLTREVVSDIPLLWFRGNLHRRQKRFAEQVIKDLGLTVYGFPPAHAYLKRSGEELTLIREYDIGGERLPVLWDVTASDFCTHKPLPARLLNSGFDWDASLIGWKAADYHPVLGKIDMDSLTLGATTFATPLKNFTHADVWEAIHQLGVPYDKERYDEQKAECDPDLLLICDGCFEQVVGLAEAA